MRPKQFEMCYAKHLTAINWLMKFLKSNQTDNKKVCSMSNGKGDILIKRAINKTV